MAFKISLHPSFYDNPFTVISEREEAVKKDKKEKEKRKGVLHEKLFVMLTGHLFILSCLKL